MSNFRQRANSISQYSYGILRHRRKLVLDTLGGGGLIYEEEKNKNEENLNEITFLSNSIHRPN